MKKLWCALVETCGFKGNFGSWPFVPLWSPRAVRYVTHCAVAVNGNTQVLLAMSKLDGVPLDQWLLGSYQNQGICWFIGWGVPRVCWVFWKDNRRPMLYPECSFEIAKNLFWHWKTWLDRKDMRCKHGKASRLATVVMASWAWEFENSLRFSRFGRLHFSPTSPLNDMPWPVRYCTCSLRFLPAVEGDTSSAQVQPLWWGCMGSMSTSWKSLAGAPSLSMPCSWSSSGASLSYNWNYWSKRLFQLDLLMWKFHPSLHIEQVRRSFFFSKLFTYSTRVLMSMNPWIHLCMSHLWIHRNAVRLRHARSPRWAPAEGPAIHQDLGMECPLKKEGFSYTYVWNYLKSWWYSCGAHRFCELLWHFFGLKFVLIDQVEPHLVESPRRPTSESVCFRLLAKRCFFITHSMATFSNIVISSEPQFPFHPKHPGGAWSLQVMSSQLGKTQRFVLGREITSSFWHGTREVHGLGKQKSLT